jgi:hypothetical protein
MILEGFLFFCGFLSMVGMVLYFTCIPEDDDGDVLLLD